MLRSPCDAHLKIASAAWSEWMVARAPATCPTEFKLSHKAFKLLALVVPA